METPVLRIDHLTVRYGKTCDYCRNGGKLDKNTCPRCKTVWACNDVNVELFEGEILGIVGESGSGKSTLMKSLYFDFDVTEGQGFLKNFKDGKADIFSQSLQQKKYIKNHVMGMVYQNPMMGLRMEYSSAGNIAEKLIAAGQRNFGGMNERVSELLDAVEILQSRKKEPPKNFSGGMQQRVGIARALAIQPQILLMDEPFSALDEFTKEKLHEDLLRIWAKTNKTIIFVTHNIQEAVFLSSRICVLSPHPGRLSAVIDVDLPRPRTMDIKDTPEFTAYVAKVRNSFEGI